MFNKKAYWYHQMPKPIIQVADDAPGRGGLVERTMTDIRRLIGERQLMPGDSLPAENALAAELGVSRTIAREALRGLAALQIVEVGNGRRARVASSNADALSLILDHTVHTRQLSIQQVLDVRRTLETRTVNLAALRRSDAEAAELQRIVAAMQVALDGNHEEIMELDIRFHEVIARASGNALYSILIESFRVITRQTWHIGWRARGSYHNRRDNIHLHDRIARAIAAHDADAAEAAMSEHFDGAVATLLRAGIN